MRLGVGEKTRDGPKVHVQATLAKNEDQGGLHQWELRIAVARVVPDLKDATFRSYLHRFRKEGVIEKRSSGKWMLTADRDKRGGAV